MMQLKDEVEQASIKRHDSFTRPLPIASWKPTGDQSTIAISDTLASWKPVTSSDSSISSSRPLLSFRSLLPAMAVNGTYSGSSCSSTSAGSLRESTDDDHMIAMMLSEEYAKLDGAVANCIPNLAPIALVPRINSYIPTYSDASMDHQRLAQRLQVYGLCEVRVSGDGNCQFRALSDQMFRSPDYHKHVRKDIVKQLKENKCFYEGYVPMEYKKYYKKIAKSGEWGDHVTLQAAADRFGAKICLLTSFRDTCFIEILPRNSEPKRVLWLSFWSEVHYNSLYANHAVQGAPVQQKGKKLHWLF